MSEAANASYQGLTHLCSDPDCHVPGFVATLRLKAGPSWPYLPCPVCQGSKSHAAACSVPVLGLTTAAPAQTQED